MDKILNRLKIRRGISATDSHIHNNAPPQQSPSTPCTTKTSASNESNPRSETATDDDTNRVVLSSRNVSQKAATEEVNLPRISTDYAEQDHQQNLIHYSTKNSATHFTKDIAAIKENETAESENKNCNPSPIKASISTNTLQEAGKSMFQTFMESVQSENRKVSMKDFDTLCVQLHQTLDYIKSADEFKDLIYRYPSKQQKRLEEEAQDLLSLQSEIRAAMLSVQQVKNQRKAVRRECNAVLKTITKIKDEEVKEMENFVSLYDKTLLARWEKIRNSTQEEMIESFLHDLQGKQQALSHLQTLASHKLGQLKSKTNLSEETKPTIVAVKRLSAGGRSNGTRWRAKHNDRVVRGPTSSTNQDTINQSVVPAIPTALSIPQLTSTAGPSSASSASASGLGLGSLNTNINSPNLQMNINIGEQNLPEHRSMLQALFSNLQQFETHDNLPINAVMPEMIHSTSGATGSHGRESSRRPRTQQNSNTDSESEYQDIELFSIKNPS